MTVEQCDRLHGKVYHFGQAVMIGSSNVSANGLSFDGPDALGWAEANLVTEDAEVVRAASEWIDSLPTRAVTPEDLRHAEKKWKTRRQAMPAPRTKASIVQLLDQDPSSFAGLDVYLTLTAGDLTPEAEGAVREAKKDHPRIDAWEDWEELPAGGTFISFTAGDDGAFDYENTFRRTPEFPDRPDGRGRHSLQWCFASALPLGLKSPRSESRRWAEVIGLVVSERGRLETEGGLYVSLEELAALWKKNKQT